MPNKPKPDVYTVGSYGRQLDQMCRTFYKVDPKLTTGQILQEIEMQQKKARATNTLELAAETIQNTQHNLNVATSGSTILRNAQVDTPDAGNIRASVDQQIQTLSGDVAARIQEAQTLNKSLDTAFDDEQIKAILDTKAVDGKKMLAEGMENNLVRQQAAVEVSLGKYESNLKTTYAKSVTVAKDVSHTVQAATGQSLPQALAEPKVAPR